MAQLRISQVFILVIWVSVLVSVIPHAVVGDPIRPVPLGHLTWLTSSIALWVMWKRRKSHPEEKQSRTGERMQVYAPVVAGAFVAMVVGTVGGTLRLDPLSLLVTFAFVVVPIGLGKAGLVASGALALTLVGFYGGTVGPGTPAPPAPWWSLSANKYSPRYNANAHLGPLMVTERETVMNYARGLFDPDAHVVWQEYPNWDNGRMAVSDGRTVRNIPLAPVRVLTQRDAWRIHPVSYAPDTIWSGRVGRVVARIAVANDSVGPAFTGLPPGDYFVWIDSLTPLATNGPQTVRAVFLPTNMSRTPVTTRIPFRRRAEWMSLGKVSLASRFKQRVFPSTIAPHLRGTWFSTGLTDDVWVPCAMKASCRLFEGDR